MPPEKEMHRAVPRRGLPNESIRPSDCLDDLTPRQLSFLQLPERVVAERHPHDANDVRN